MGFGRKKKQGKKTVWITLLLLILVVSVGASGYFWHIHEIDKIESEHRVKVKILEDEKIMKTKLMVLADTHLKSGTTITKDNTTKGKVMLGLDVAMYICEDDYGKSLLVDVQKGMPITKNMVKDEKITDEIREQELTMIMIPSHIEQDQYVDIRIGFPNGEDYIVLSKKKVKNVDLQSLTLWLWLSEKEILTLSSAVVDAYIHEGTKLYALTYVKPEQQKEAIVNYPVNEAVALLIEENPNIIQQAKMALSSEIRTALEEKLINLDTRQLQEVENGIQDESQQRQEAIVTKEEDIQDEKDIAESSEKQEILKPTNEEKDILKVPKIQMQTEVKQPEKEEGENDPFF